jgi:hypothetical protein
MGRVVCTVAFLVTRRVLGLIGIGLAQDATDVEIALLRLWAPEVGLGAPPGVWGAPHFPDSWLLT